MADRPTNRSVNRDVNFNHTSSQQTNIVPRIDTTQVPAIPEGKVALDQNTKSLYFSANRSWNRMATIDDVIAEGDCCCISIRWAVGQDWAADIYPTIVALAGYSFGTVTGEIRNVVVYVDPDITTPRLLNGNTNNLNRVCFVGSIPTQRSVILFDPLESPNNIDVSDGYVRLYGKNVVFQSSARTFSGVAARIDLDSAEIFVNSDDFYRSGQTSNFWCVRNSSLVSSSDPNLSVCTLSNGGRLIIFASTSSTLGPKVANSGAPTNLDIYHDSTVALVSPLTDGGTPPVTQIILVGDAPTGINSDGCCCNRD